MSRNDEIDPDIAFGIIINKGVSPEKIYDDEITVTRLVPDVYELVTDGSDHELSVGITYILELYDTDVQCEVWETTELNDYRFATTVVVC